MKRNTQLPRNKVSEKSRSEITGLGCTSCVLPPCVTLASSSVFPSLITYLPGKKQLLGFSQLQINRHMSQWATWEKDPNKQTQQLTLEERNNSWKSESEVARSCPTLCDPVDCSPPGSSVHGIFQARILEWVAISFSRGSSQPRDRTQVSRIAGRHLNLWATRQAGLITHGLKQIKK